MGFGKFLQCKESSSSFAQRETAGDSEEIAANTGVASKVQSFIFLPEEAERWTGTYFGSMQSTKTYGEL